MAKIGRNDPCLCGSGRKYKKCCLGKTPEVSKLVGGNKPGLMTFEEVDSLNTEEIIQGLASLGIRFQEEEFLRQVDECYSAEEISEKWWAEFDVAASGRTEDFPWLAAWVLWERFAPAENLSMEQLNQLLLKGWTQPELDNRTGACDLFLQVWEGLKYKCRNQVCSLDFLDKQYGGTFFVSNFVQDLDMALHNAGLVDRSYFEKRVKFCDDFLALFVQEDADTLHKVRRSKAESCGELEDFERADAEFEKLAKDYPQNPWTYIAWGDVYGFGRNKIDATRAKQLYRKALELATDKYDRMTVQERLDDL